jgi:hypothetical protein
VIFPCLYAVKDMTTAAAVAVAVVATATIMKTMAEVTLAEAATMLTAEARVKAWR